DRLHMSSSVFPGGRCDRVLEPTSRSPPLCKCFLASSPGCQLSIVGQNGPVTTSLSVLVARSAPGTVDALGPVIGAGPFGVGKTLAVILAASAFLLGAMVVGGHLGDLSRRRKDRRKRR